MTELPARAGHGGPQRERRPVVLPQADPFADFDGLYRSQMGPLTVFLMRMGASAYEAADAAHEAFVSTLPDTWRSLAYPKAYLRTTAYRCYLRQATSMDRPTDPVPDRPGGTCPLQLLELTAEQERVADALLQLPFAQREAMAWVLDGFSYAEIAQHLGKTPATVRQNYRHARIRLVEILGLKGKEER
ncbi:sigma-70 family RNA polymerase sigma factor [Streptomyces sp. NPDC060028]|uniref:sigma-70 family RNA polymerase sigma factor n=1 Tax=Streptomyces sp. NPDC060028 TaxID=3347041 RepID=UPI0036BCB496